MLACLAAFAVLSLFEDRILIRTLITLTTHEKPGPRFDPIKTALIAEHLRWWILALPLAALLVIHWPWGGVRRSGNTRPAACPPFVIGLFALQLCLGGSLLTGTWTAIAERFWAPTPASDDQIRAAYLPRGSLASSRRLEARLPRDAKIYVLTDRNETPIFLNYYLYPRRLYSSETAAESGYVEEVGRPEFWDARRAEGFRWIFIHRPSRDPSGGGHLIELIRDESKEENDSEDQTP